MMTANRRRVLTGIALFAGILLFFFWRSRYAFLLPVLACEDGGTMLSYYNNHPAPREILRFYAGYVSLLPNLVGYLSVQWLPLRLVPVAMALYPLLLVSVTYTVFYLPQFRALITDDRLRLLVVIFLALMPLGLIHFVNNTTYSIWNLLLLLLLLTLVPATNSLFARALTLIAMILAALSTPLSIVVIPVFVLNLIRHKRWADRIMNAMLIGVVGLYLVWGTQPTNTSLLADLPVRIDATMRYLSQRAVAEAVIGYNQRLALFQSGQTWIIHMVTLSVCVALAAVIYWRRSRFTQESFISLGILLYYTGAITFLSVLTRQMDAVSHMGAWNNRYFYVQHVLLWLIVAVVITQAFDWQQTATQIRVLVMALVFVYAGWMAREHLYLYRTSYSDGVQLATFLAEVNSARAELAPGERADFYLQRACFDINLTYTGK